MPAIWIIAPITLAVLFAIQFAPPDESARFKFVRSVLLLPMGPWVDGVYWTLPIEVSFYALVFALLSVDRFIWIGRTMSTVGLTSAAF